MPTASVGKVRPPSHVAAKAVVPVVAVGDGEAIGRVLKGTVAQAAQHQIPAEPHDEQVALPVGIQINGIGAR